MELGDGVASFGNVREPHLGLGRDRLCPGLAKGLIGVAGKSFGGVVEGDEDSSLRASHSVDDHDQLFGSVRAVDEGVDSRRAAGHQGQKPDHLQDATSHATPSGSTSRGKTTVSAGGDAGRGG